MLYDSIEHIVINIMYFMHVASLEENHKESSKLVLIIWPSKIASKFYTQYSTSSLQLSPCNNNVNRK